jgi:Flp pilus assembly pilin Flp
MPDWLQFSLNLTLVGLLIVFGSLTVIAVVVSLVRRVDDGWKKREAAQEQAAMEKEPSIDNLTLVLISAAVATMISGRFYIKRVRRLLPPGAVTGQWSAQGRAILLGSHVVPKRGQR